MANPFIQKAFAIVKGLLLSLAVVIICIWAGFAIFYSDVDSVSARWLLIGAFSLAGIATIFAITLRYRRRPALLGFAILFALLVGWWTTIEPSNDRDWLPEVAQLAHADIQGDIVTVRNIRNFDYRSETDFTPAYYDKTFDLNKLQSVDL
ncbi:hypothetical protein [Methylophaga sp. OBS4]|uniref:hypothetical protein n=1 Tax=Methylophaga sp. OBS4 TaxID=2991935 RepID=UPI0022575EC9|nr:hypothetical protein [Methylophaga sp. OBS4]MCX4186868.1 hypothetical protein [Methylophaga sp. OBS4]